jgi:gamma-glutamylcysteine synthetase
MKEVAGRLNIDKRSLYKHSSSLCRTISARHAEYQKICCQEQQNRHAINTRQVYNALEANGIYPSRRRVAALLKKASVCVIEGQPPSSEIAGS